MAARGRRRGPRRPPARRSSPAGRPSASRSPARWPPTHGCCCSTSPWPPSTSLSLPRCGRRCAGCWQDRTAMHRHPRRTRRAPARRPRRRPRRRPGRRGRADRARCWPGRAARSPPGSPGSTWCRSGATGTLSRTPDGLRVEGQVAEPGPTPATPPSQSSGPARSRSTCKPPGGSPRNVLARRRSPSSNRSGDQVRVRADGLSADVTAAGGRRARPGARAASVFFVVKATEVAVYRS